MIEHLRSARRGLFLAQLLIAIGASSAGAQDAGPRLLGAATLPLVGTKVDVPDAWTVVNEGQGEIINRLRPISPLLRIQLAGREGGRCAEWESFLRDKGALASQLVRRPEVAAAPWHPVVFDRPSASKTLQVVEACLELRRGVILASASYTLTDPNADASIATILQLVAGAAIGSPAPAAPRATPPTPAAPQPAAPAPKPRGADASLLPRVELPAVDRYDPRQLESLERLIDQGYAGGHHAWALPIAERVLAIRERALGAAHPDVERDIASIVRLHVGAGDSERAEAATRRALANAEKRGVAALAVALDRFAAIFQDAYDFGRAEPMLERAVQVRERSSGADHPVTAAALRSLAKMRFESGDYVGSQAPFDRALAILDKRFGPSGRELVDVLVDVGHLHQARGDHPAAKAAYERARRIGDATLPPQDLGRRGALRGLAEIAEVSGDYETASKLYTEAGTISSAALGNGSPESLGDIGDAMRCELHDAGGAEFLERHALEQAERRLGSNHPAVARALVTASKNYLREPARVQQMLERALSIRERALGKDHPDVAASLAALAAHAERTRDTKRAVDLRRRGGEIRERNIGLVLAVGSELQKRMYVGTLEAETHATVSLHARGAPADPDAARLAALTILRRKGRVLDAVTDTMGALRRNVTPEQRALVDELERVRTQLSSAVLRGPGKMAAAPHAALVERLEARAQALEAKIGERGASSLAGQTATLERVHAAIPADAVLVELFAYRPWSHSELGSTLEASRYVAYVLRPGGDVAWTDLGETAPVDAIVAKLRAALANPDADARPAARELGARVVSKLRPLFGGARHVLLSPDGGLNLVPFGALLDERDEPLVKTTTFTYLTSGRDLLRLAKHDEARGAPLLVAAPDFGPKASASASAGSSRGGDLSRAFFGPLPGTEQEARALAPMLSGASVLVGGAADEASVKKAARPRLLHVATHGFFLAGTTQGATGTRALELEAAGPTDTRAFATDNPLLRSGLAFAGANGRGAGADDGLLTALEASGLDLRGTELVVLSACETGVGEVRGGEGVYGLRRALVIAGAETQVMSLWKVDDEATRDLMVGYYRRLSEGRGRSEALRDAQLEMLSSPARKHPYFWASFIPSGSWKPLAAAAAPPSVERGAGGCGCEVAGAPPRRDAGGIWIVLATIAAVVARAIPRGRSCDREERGSR